MSRVKGDTKIDCFIQPKSLSFSTISPFSFLSTALSLSRTLSLKRVFLPALLRLLCLLLIFIFRCQPLDWVVPLLRVPRSLHQCWLLSYCRKVSGCGSGRGHNYGHGRCDCLLILYKESKPSLTGCKQENANQQWPRPTTEDHRNRVNATYVTTPSDNLFFRSIA